jgi:uncharacterized protein (DUF2141 family)
MKYLVAITLLLTMYACASQMPPTGGPKDEDPPILILSNPENLALNWNQEEITLTFDEAVQLKDLNTQLLITPSYPGEYVAKPQREQVSIKFDQPFNDSTTYTLNFRNGIVDLNEGNPAVDLRLAFSTGNYMDSMKISGRINDLLHGVPMADATVGLYLASDSITPLNGKPYYLSKSNKAGFYNFYNLKADDYYLYAFQDKNNNAKLDSKTEAYGFLSESITLDTTKIDMDIDVVRLDLTDMEISSSRQVGQYFEIKFSKYVNIDSIQQIDTTNIIPLFYQQLESNRTLKFYNTLNELDSIGIAITYSDSLLTTSTDTVYVGFVETLRKSDDFTVTPDINIVDSTMIATINFSKPYQSIQLDSILITYDSLNTAKLDTSNLIEDSNFFQLILEKDFSSDTAFSMEPQRIPSIDFKAGTFISIESDTSSLINRKIVPKKAISYGSIQGLVEIEEPNYILQLLNKDQKVVATRINSSSYLFRELLAGKYKIRVILDENGNGEWDGGSIHTLRQPEDIFFFEAENKDREINLRSNWELVDMDIKKPVEDVDNLINNSVVR